VKNLNYRAARGRRKRASKGPDGVPRTPQG
jgi:hypothetical protein